MPAIVRELAFGSETYKKSLELRERVLRVPQWQRLSDADLAGEDAQIHLAAFETDATDDAADDDASREVSNRGPLVGCVVLKPLGDGVVKLRQMAVEPSRQRQGIGRTLVAHALDVAREAGFDEMMMDARVSAEAFYRSLGFASEGERYELIGVAHIRMRQLLR